MEENREVTLVSLKGGAAMELFQRELDAVLDNIADVNTSATAKRTITLTVVFSPGDEREDGEVEVYATAKLARVRSAKGRVWFGTKAGRPVAVESNPRQIKLGLDEPRQ